MEKKPESQMFYEKLKPFNDVMAWFLRAFIFSSFGFLALAVSVKLYTSDTPDTFLAALAGFAGTFFIIYSIIIWYSVFAYFAHFFSETTFVRSKKLWPTTLIGFLCASMFLIVPFLVGLAISLVKIIKLL